MCVCYTDKCGTQKKLHDNKKAVASNAHSMSANKTMEDNGPHQKSIQQKTRIHSILWWFSAKRFPVRLTDFFCMAASARCVQSGTSGK